MNSNITFGQLARGGAKKAEANLSKLLSLGPAARRKKKVSFDGRVVAAPVPAGDSPPASRRLKVVETKVRGTGTYALLDTGALPNMMTEKFPQRLGLAPTATSRRITVADDGKRAVVRDVKSAPVHLGSLTVPMNFLVLCDAPCDVIIGLPKMEALGAKLDTKHQMVTPSLAGGDVSTTLHILKDRPTSSDEDGDGFTLGSDWDGDPDRTDTNTTSSDCDEGVREVDGCDVV